MLITPLPSKARVSRKRKGRKTRRAKRPTPATFAKPRRRPRRRSSGQQREAPRARRASMLQRARAGAAFSLTGLLVERSCLLSPRRASVGSLRPPCLRRALLLTGPLVSRLGPSLGQMPSIGPWVMSIRKEPFPPRRRMQRRPCLVTFAGRAGEGPIGKALGHMFPPTSLRGGQSCLGPAPPGRAGPQPPRKVRMIPCSLSGGGSCTSLQ